MTCDVFEMPDGRKVAGLAIPGPPAPEAGHAVVRYLVDRGNGYCVEYGTDLAEVFRAFLDRGPRRHEFFAEAVPTAGDPNPDDAPVRRCEWTAEGGWGRWHRE